MRIQNIPYAYIEFRARMLLASWTAMAFVTALAIAWDMRRLAVNRVGLPLLGWGVMALAFGVLAIPAYLRQRAIAKQRLISAVWTMAGDANVEQDVRMRRLEGLHRVGLVGKPIYRACLKQLEQR